MFRAAKLTQPIMDSKLAEVSGLLVGETGLREVAFGDEFDAKRVEKCGAAKGFVGLATETLELDQFAVEEQDHRTVHSRRCKI